MRRIAECESKLDNLVEQIVDMLEQWSIDVPCSVVYLDGKKEECRFTDKCVAASSIACKMMAWRYIMDKVETRIFEEENR